MKDFFRKILNLSISLLMRWSGRESKVLMITGKFCTWQRIDPLAQLLKRVTIAAVCLRFDSWEGQIGQRHHRCDVSSELCCPGADSRRWISLLVARSACYREYNEDLISIHQLRWYSDIVHGFGAVDSGSIPHLIE